MRGTISLKSSLVTMPLGSGSQKLGQPVPLSYLALELNRGSWQPAQTKVPARFSLLRGLLKGRSVPSSRKTTKAPGLSRCFHSALLSSQAGSPALEAAKAALAPPKSTANPDPKLANRLRRFIALLQPASAQHHGQA